MRRLKRVAVSGATSFFGSTVVRALLKRDCEVYGIVRPSSNARSLLPHHSSFHEVLCDISETEKWMDSIGEADTFFHFAWGGPGIQGRSDPIVQGQSAVNTMRCLESAARLGVSRFFISGSQAEYGKINGMISEDTPCNPLLEYGKNKYKVCREAPVAARRLGMEYVHARIFSLYGPNDHPYTLIPSCIRCFLADEVMELSECKNMWNFLHVEDAAQAAILLAECDLDEPSVVVNLAGPDTRILRSFVEEIHELCGNRGKCAFGTRHVSETPVDSWPDIRKLQSMIQWTPKISFSEGVGDLIRKERARKA